MSRDGAIYRRTCGPASVSAAARLWKEGAAVTIGQDRNRTTGSSYKRHSGGLMIARHFVLTAVLWDIFAAANYKVAFVSDLTAAPTDLLVINAAYAAAGGSAEETIVVQPNIILTPGVYYLSLYTDPAVRYDDRNAVTVEVNTYLWLRNASYDGGSTGSYSLPIKLVGYPASVQQVTAFAPWTV